MPSDAAVARPAAVTVRHLLLPGWLDSDPSHWQSRWERVHGCERVQQDDWLWPRRGDWMARLDEVLQAQPGAGASAVLIAHSLGCHLVAAWAAHSRHAAQVRAALLVAPPDTDRDDMPPNLFNWRSIVRRPLPFASTVVISGDDPFCAPARAAGMARDWGSATVEIGACGHINGASNLGDWPAGWALAQALTGVRPVADR